MKTCLSFAVEVEVIATPLERSSVAANLFVQLCLVQSLSDEVVVLFVVFLDSALAAFSVLLLILLLVIVS